MYSHTTLSVISCGFKTLNIGQVLLPVQLMDFYFKFFIYKNNASVNILMQVNVGQVFPRVHQLIWNS